MAFLDFQTGKPKPHSARMVIASMLQDAAEVYGGEDTAFRLRQMHLLNEGVKTSGGAIVVPSAYTEGFTDGAAAKEG